MNRKLTLAFQELKKGKGFGGSGSRHIPVYFRRRSKTTVVSADWFSSGFELKDSDATAQAFLAGFEPWRHCTVSKSFTLFKVRNEDVPAAKETLCKVLSRPETWVWIDDGTQPATVEIVTGGVE